MCGLVGLMCAIVAQGAIVRDGGTEEAKTYSVEQAKVYKAAEARAAETTTEQAKDSDLASEQSPKPKTELTAQVPADASAGGLAELAADALDPASAAAAGSKPGLVANLVANLATGSTPSADKQAMDAEVAKYGNTVAIEYAGCGSDNFHKPIQTSKQPLEAFGAIIGEATQNEAIQKKKSFQGSFVFYDPTGLTSLTVSQTQFMTSELKKVRGHKGVQRPIAKLEPSATISGKPWMDWLYQKVKTKGGVIHVKIECP